MPSVGISVSLKYRVRRLFLESRSYPGRCSSLAWSGSSNRRRKTPTQTPSSRSNSRVGRTHEIQNRSQPSKPEDRRRTMHQVKDETKGNSQICGSWTSGQWVLASHKTYPRSMMPEKPPSSTVCWGSLTLTSLLCRSPDVHQMAASDNRTTRLIGREGNQMKIAFMVRNKKLPTILDWTTTKRHNMYHHPPSLNFDRSSEHPEHLCSHALFFKWGKGWFLRGPWSH